MFINKVSLGKFTFSLLFVTTLITGCGGEPLLTHCEYTDDVFDFYEGNEIFAGENIALDPYQSLDFSQFNIDGIIIEDAGGTNDQPSIDVTSGKIWARHEASERFGYTGTYNFRMLAVPNDPNTQWNDKTVTATFYPEAWQETNQTPPGMHLFARYQTENDLYVASLRSNGSVYIFRKLCGKYVKIASNPAKDSNNAPLAVDGELPLNTWYKLEFSVIGNFATFIINDVQQFKLDRYNRGTVDLTVAYEPGQEPLMIIPSGTAGIRLDYVDTIIGTFEVTEPLLPAPATD